MKKINLLIVPFAAAATLVACGGGGGGDEPKDNEITELSLADWTYGDEANTPIAKAKYGQDKIVYTYSSKEGGTYVGKVPTDAGDYWVKATIAETKEYKGAEKTASFKINQREVILDWENVQETYTYSGAANVMTPKVKNLVSGDDCKVIATLKGDSTNVTGNKFHYEAQSLDGKDKRNYKLPESTGSKSSPEASVVAKPLKIKSLEAPYSANGVFTDVVIGEKNTDDYAIAADYETIEVKITYKKAQSNTLTPGEYTVYNNDDWSVEVTKPNSNYNVILTEEGKFIFTIDKIPVVLTATFGAPINEQIPQGQTHITEGMVKGVVEGVEWDSDTTIKMQIPENTPEGIYNDVKSLKIVPELVQSEGKKYYKLDENENHITLAVHNKESLTDIFGEGAKVTVDKGTTKVYAVKSYSEKNYQLKTYPSEIVGAELLGDNPGEYCKVYKMPANKDCYLAYKGTGAEETLQLIETTDGSDILSDGLSGSTDAVYVFTVADEGAYTLSVTAGTPTFVLFKGTNEITKTAGDVTLDKGTHVLRVRAAADYTFKLEKK